MRYHAAIILKHYRGQPKDVLSKKQKKIKLARKLYPQTTFKLINEQEFYNFLTKDKEKSIKEAIAS